MTDEAKTALGGASFVRAGVFPFNIGRESRATNALSRAAVNVERRLSTVPPLNHLYLIEPADAQVMQISRKHCAIDRVGHGFVLLDRNSACGAAVVHAAAPLSGTTPYVDRIGIGTPTDRTLLADGDLIIIGNEDSPYVYRFELDRHWS
jgi:hypothetical protein